MSTQCSHGPRPILPRIRKPNRRVQAPESGQCGCSPINVAPLGYQDVYIADGEADALRQSGCGTDHPILEADGVGIDLVQDYREDPLQLRWIPQHSDLAVRVHYSIMPPGTDKPGCLCLSLLLAPEYSCVSVSEQVPGNRRELPERR